jgi:hypothetical protein
MHMDMHVTTLAKNLWATNGPAGRGGSRPNRFGGPAPNSFLLNLHFTRSDPGTDQEKYDAL